MDLVDIVITEFMDAAAVEQLRRDFSIHYDPQLADQPDIIAQLAQTSPALIVRNRTQVRGVLLDACQHLRVVGRLGVGLDNIDLTACEQRGIQVLPASGANTIAVAEYVLAVILLLRRGAFFASAEVLAGHWPRERLSGLEISGTQLGLVGFGAIAQAVAQRAQALGMTVMSYDPFVAETTWTNTATTRCDSLPELLAVSDVISLHVPLNNTTHHLLSADTLSAIKPGAVLINTARGGIVDEAALAEALHSGHLAGAALDVFEHEPLAAHSVLEDVPNLILTPHIAGITQESNRRVSAVTADNVRHVLRGTS